MAAVTDEAFETLLDEEIAWRRIELLALVRKLDSESRLNSSSPLARALARSLVTLLYAHWEGFCKTVFESYVKLVLRRKPLVREAAASLIVEHLQQLFRRLESGDQSAVESVVALARGTSTERIRLSQDRIVDTKSNLRFRVLAEIMSALSISFADFELKQNLIDVHLCDARNEIAHGRARFPPPPDIIELTSTVIEMMEVMRDLMIGQVRAKAYTAAS